MAEDEATEEVSIDDDVPVDDVLADAQDTLADIEGADGGGGDLDGGLGASDAGTGSGGGVAAGVDRGLDTSRGTTSRSRDASPSDGGSWLPDSLSDLFSLTHFAGAGLLSVLAAVLAQVFVPIPVLGSAVGLFLAGFLLGAVADRSSYAEVGIATGAVGAAVAFLVSIPLLPVGGIGVPVFAIGAGVSLVVGLLGHYFGRDLRSGLQRDVGGDDEPF